MLGEIVKVSWFEYVKRVGRTPDHSLHVLFGWPPGVRVFCLHCGGSFLVGNELHDLADGLLVCPVEGCDGSPLDWSLEPWS